MDQFSSDQRNDSLQHLTETDSNNKLVLFSLLNTICNYDPSGWLPYNHLLFSDPQEPLFTSSLHLLLLLLYGNFQKNNQKNIFIKTFQEEFSSTHFDFILNKFSYLLHNPIKAKSTYLPHAKKSISSYKELFSLLWIFFLESPKFLKHFLESKYLSILIHPYLYFLFNLRKSNEEIDFLKLLIYTIHHFSSQRNFGRHQISF